MINNKILKIILELIWIKLIIKSENAEIYKYFAISDWRDLKLYNNHKNTSISTILKNKILNEKKRHIIIITITFYKLSIFYIWNFFFQF